MNDNDIKKITQQIIESLANDGRIIEGGWVAMRRTMIPLNASETQISDMRTAYYSGAQHLFASIINILDPGIEPTERDLDRMTLIHNELEEFRKEMERRYHANKRETDA